MVKTNDIFISNRDRNYTEILDKADEFIDRQGFDRKTAIRLRLIVEETTGMVRAMAGVFNAKLWLERDDENKTFGIAFRTVPQDHTGIFHILEHSVLNGSEKYPLREPFVNLLKSSLRCYEG